MLLNTVLFALLATAANADITIQEKIDRLCEAHNVTADTFKRVQVYFNGHTESSKLPQLAELRTELEAAALNRQNGSVDEVARKYCAKAEEIKFSWAEAYWAGGLCQKLDEQKDIAYAAMILRRMLEYVCNEADNTTILAKFVDEGALQCCNKSSKEFSMCLDYLHVREDMKARFENMSRCVVEPLKTCSNAVSTRVHNMFEYVSNISTTDLKAIYENMTRWVEEKINPNGIAARTQKQLENIPNGACQRAIISVQYVAVIVLAAILSALPAIRCNIQQHV